MKKMLNELLESFGTKFAKHDVLSVNNVLNKKVSIHTFIVVISQANHRIHPTGCHDTAIHNLEFKKRGTLGEIEN